AGQRELVSMADTRGLHFDQHLSGLRPVEVDLRDDKRLGLLQGNGGASFHGGFLLVISAHIDMADPRPCRFRKLLPKIAEGRSHGQLLSDANSLYQKNSLISPTRQHKNLSESSPLARVQPLERRHSPCSWQIAFTRRVTSSGVA